MVKTKARGKKRAIRRSAATNVTERWTPVTSILTQSNARVTGDSAMQVSAVMACVRVLAETLAGLPLHIYEELPGGGKQKVLKHPLQILLAQRPNSWQTGFEWREMLMGHIVLRGNAFCQIIDDGGYIQELIPLNPDRMKIERSGDGSLTYIYTLPNSGLEKRFGQDDIFHLRGLSNDGLSGVTPIRLHAEAIGLALAAESTGASFYRNAMQLGAVLKHPGTLSTDAHARLRDSMREKYAGTQKTGETMILEEGMTWERLGVVPEEAQFIETRKFQVSDIARIFRVPPHLIGDLERSTFSNIEHQSIDFVTHTMLPWVIRWEQALQRDLFDNTDRKRGYYLRFSLDGLLRGDAINRSTALQIQFRNGVINQDEWRALEDRNPLPNGEGQKFFVALELSPSNVERKESVKEEGGEEAIKASWIEDISGRIAGAESRLFEENRNSDPEKTERKSREYLGIILPAIFSTCGQSPKVSMAIEKLVAQLKEHIERGDITNRREQIAQTLRAFLSGVNYGQGR